MTAPTTAAPAQLPHQREAQRVVEAEQGVGGRGEHGATQHERRAPERGRAQEGEGGALGTFGGRLGDGGLDGRDRDAGHHEQGHDRREAAVGGGAEGVARHAVEGEVRGDGERRGGQEDPGTVAGATEA
ncbi:MAG: hypothetical protein M5U14_13685 [Acidimicrobiia bacterium]|nr:hypothetical protein [Acidimicrobiia bacterium]